MGYNVTCSISSLSIPENTEVYFLPLLPNIYNDNEKHYVGVQSNLIYPNHYFNPFCLPIKGVYNGYDSLKNIIEDDNTKAIEKYFNLSIQQIVDIITDNPASVTNVDSEYFKIFALNKEIMKDSNIIKFDHDFMIKLGFDKHETITKKYEYYTFKNFEYKVYLYQNEHENNEFGFRIYDKNDSLVYSCDGHHAKTKIQFAYKKLADYYLNISEENQQKVKLLKSLSGMFIHADIYDKLSMYENKTNYRVEYFEQYKKYIESILEFDKEILELKNMLKNTTDEIKKKPIEILIEAKLDTNNAQFFGGLRNFMQSFSDCEYFFKLYRQLIMQNKLSNEFVNFKIFYQNIYQCNKFFFPAIQTGHENTEAFKFLLENTLEIANNSL